MVRMMAKVMRVREGVLFIERPLPVICSCHQDLIKLGGFWPSNHPTFKVRYRLDLGDMSTHSLLVHRFLLRSLLLHSAVCQRVASTAQKSFVPAHGFALAYIVAEVRSYLAYIVADVRSYLAVRGSEKCQRNRGLRLRLARPLVRHVDTVGMRRKDRIYTGK